MKKGSYDNRKYVVAGIIILVGLIYLLKLFFLQVPHNSYKLSAENNVLRYITLYPSRGLIYDRDNNLMVYNEAAYDLLVVPNQLKSFDTASMCDILRITQEDFNERLAKAKKHSYYRPSVILEQISNEDNAFLEEMLYKYPGFFTQTRSLRKYSADIAAHTLGYIGEVNRREINNDSYYKMGDYIGKSGIEKSYEDILKGKKGSKIKIVDVFNRDMGGYMDGKYDTAAVAGMNIRLTIDSELQKLGEHLMENKTGSLVAIEPQTGDILTLVTSPTYDPNLLVGRIRSENYRKLSKDSLKPLLNRGIMGTYSPGSTFKMLNALIGLETGSITINSSYYCDGPESRPIRCTHYHTTPLKLMAAIQHSCNPYFWNVFRNTINYDDFGSTKEGFESWRNHTLSFGFGKTSKTDIPFEQTGSIPESQLYDRIYGETHWNSLTIRSLAIGQGEILVTPLQLANFAATIANRGYYYPPHLLKSIVSDLEEKINYEKQLTTISNEYFIPIVDAMYDAVNVEHGTAFWVKLSEADICGKTGTVENPHGDDHSMFIAFAPKDNPVIAISVIVENSGYGSTWAAPIASLMIEQYLNGSIERKWIENHVIKFEKKD